MTNPLHLLAAAVRELRGEKRVRQVSVRMSDSLWSTLSTLADRDERATTDYIVSVLERHCYGHLPPSMFGDSTMDGHSFRASQRGALEER